MLQPCTRASGVTTQETRFAIDTGAAKSVLVTVNVFENQSSSVAKVEILGATSLNLDDDIATNSFWKSLGNVSFNASTTGTGTTTLTNPPDYLRWTINTLNNTVAFEVLLEMWDT